jgi:galactonate dehydratase
MMNRRQLFCLAAAPVASLAAQTRLAGLRPNSLELIIVRATRRTSWFFVRIKTSKGLTGLGECSDSLGQNFDNQSLARLRSALDSYLAVIKDQPLSIEAYRSRARARAKAGGHLEGTAFSAIEQAQWDLLGKALGAPVYELLGGAIRTELPVYANINRVTTTRTPEGFAANAQKAVAEGFRAIKAAPFDGFPKIASAPADQIAKATDLGIACIQAMRKTIGPDVRLLIDVHSNFDVKLAIDVAKRLEPEKLGWYEEPVAPVKLEETRAIRKGITQPMAGGEILFGVEGFVGLCRTKALEVIMPDVKHCGGILEGRNISALAELEGVKVAPHNPSGPVATAASAQWCATIPNFDVLEYQWNEVPWRGDLVSPPERFVKGAITAHSTPGFGIELNDRVIKAYETLG